VHVINLLHGLEKTQTDLYAIGPACFQKSVVKSFAVTDAVAVAIEAHSGYEHHVDAASFDKLMMPWLIYVPSISD
jgi:hypothetical protein